MFDEVWGKEECRCTAQLGNLLCTDHGPLQYEDVDDRWMLVDLEGDLLLELPEMVAPLSDRYPSPCERCGLGWYNHVGVNRQCLLGPTTYKRGASLTDSLESWVLLPDGQPYHRYAGNFYDRYTNTTYAPHVGVRLPRAIPAAIPLLYRLALVREQPEDEERAWGWYPYETLDVETRAETNRLIALGDETEVSVDDSEP